MKQVQRKIIQVGNSDGVSLPKEVLNHLDAQKGDVVSFSLEENGRVTFKKHESYQIDGITSEFLKDVESAIEDYDEMLRNLANR
ncbi:AbrB/MazE/SpoVT family DNA-binding domain-containing protein [Litoribacterium kuwaitense]|uniref:AbrB/MazE/SpoVT family DNA-binding domain-containing protein n=1 Tax=Litoribacterium kuwaitense TaxID=1398745 RepID=UPI0035E4558A